MRRFFIACSRTACELTSISAPPLLVFKGQTAASVRTPGGGVDSVVPGEFAPLFAPKDPVIDFHPRGNLFRQRGVSPFAMITGVKNGWLPQETYGPAARKAWLGLVKHIDQNANITDVCEGNLTCIYCVIQGLHIDVNREKIFSLSHLRLSLRKNRTFATGSN